MEKRLVQENPGIYCHYNNLLIKTQPHQCLHVVDDIQEAYKRLRRLVMDYLGIGLNSPPGSENGEQPTDAMTRAETDQNLTNQLTTRTWSKPGSDMATSQPFTRSRGAQSPIFSGRGIVVSVISVLHVKTINLFFFIQVVTHLWTCMRMFTNHVAYLALSGGGVSASSSECSQGGSGRSQPTSHGAASHQVNIINKFIDD